MERLSQYRHDKISNVSACRIAKATATCLTLVAQVAATIKR